VSPDLTPTTLVKLGIEVLGGSTGFSVTQASSGLALCYNGQYLLIDAIPFLRHHLQSHGIARNQVQALFLSHIHDDHCNLISLLQHNRRVKILTTPLIYRMMLHKLNLSLDRSEESLEEYFTFVPLAPGKTTNYFGLRIIPFYSSHSVPTIGATFETTHDRTDYRILFTGDTQSLTDLKAMQKTGVISQERYQEIADIYRKNADLLIADGGEGLIHGDPSDALNSPAERIVFLHKDKLADRFNAHFSTASAGKRFTVFSGDTDYNLTRTIEFLLEYFPAMPPMWISNLLANQHVLKFNAGDIIIREGAKSEGRVYMMLTGHATVIHHDGEKKHILAQMEAGEIIGEMSIVTGQGIRNASVIAQTPVIVTAFSELAFREYVRHQNLEPKLKKMWQNREMLQTLPYLKNLQQPVIRDLSMHVTLEHLKERSRPKPLRNVCELHSLMMPLEHGLILRRNGRDDLIAPRAAPVLCLPEVDLVTEIEFPYLLLGPKQAAHLRARIPAFRYFWEETLCLPIPEAQKQS
jgi:CRP-like cAMP-binding protein/ribonuclease BN (tRNA processing enzyme)